MADDTTTQQTNEDAGPELKGDPVRERIIQLAFAGDRDRYDAFIRTLREAIPPDVAVVLRGSAITGTRWRSEIPFDADGPGTSDLDLTLIGGEMVKLFDVQYIPGMHTAPLSDAHPDVAITLLPLREALSGIAHRPVNIQATSDFLQYLRDIVMNQPYFTLIEKDD